MQIKKILEYSLVWRFFRSALDVLFGVYRRRMKLLNAWGVGRCDAMLDVACGTGQYAALATGRYLGVDLNCEYIRYASSSYKNEMCEFRCVDVRELPKNEQFNQVLMVGILHHLNDGDAKGLLEVLRELATDQIFLLEPVADQTNFIGAWFRDNDRGQYMRSQQHFSSMLIDAGLNIKEERTLYLGPIRTVAFQVDL